MTDKDQSFPVSGGQVPQDIVHFIFFCASSFRNIGIKVNIPERYKRDESEQINVLNIGHFVRPAMPKDSTIN